MEPSEYLDGTTVRVPEETYAVVEAQRPSAEAFASIDGAGETTLVVESDAYDEENALSVEDGWRRLTFDVVLPFELVGFLAEVAATLADAEVSVFALSAYSTDHLLVKESDLDTALAQLRALGCRIEQEAA